LGQGVKNGTKHFREGEVNVVSKTEQGPVGLGGPFYKMEWLGRRKRNHVKNFVSPAISQSRLHICGHTNRPKEVFGQKLTTPVVVRLGRAEKNRTEGSRIVMTVWGEVPCPRAV